MTKQATIQFLDFLISLAPEGETAVIVRQKPYKRDGELQYHADGALKCTWPAARSVKAGPVPLYGTCVVSTPDITLNNTPAR